MPSLVEKPRGEKLKDFRARRREAGLCVYCAKPHSTGRSYCLDCRAKSLERSREQYRRRKANSLCVSCQKAPKEEGKAQCQPCIDDNRYRTWLRYHQHELNGDAPMPTYVSVEMPKRVEVEVPKIVEVPVILEGGESDRNCDGKPATLVQACLQAVRRIVR